MKLILAALGLLTAFLSAPNAHALYAPQDAVNDALADDLQYVGSFRPTYSESGRFPTCLFRGHRVLVVVDYCVRRPLEAAKVTIHSVDTNRGFVQIYAEVRPGNNVTTARRSAYMNPFWSIGSRPNGGGFQFGMSAVRYSAYANRVFRQVGQGCRVGQSTVPGGMCNTSSSAEGIRWNPRAAEFWREPGSDWYQLLRNLKARVPMPRS